MIGRVLALGALMVLMAALTAAFDAQAQDEEDLYYEKESSTYVEFNVAASYYLINENDNDDRFSGGVGTVLGAHVTPHVSIEMQYDWQEHSSTHLASANLRYTFLTGKIQPWLKAGIGVMGGRPNHAFLFMARFGVGTNYFLTEQVAIAPSVVCAALKPSMKSASEKVSNRSVVWCQCGFAPLPVS